MNIRKREYAVAFHMDENKQNRITNIDKKDWILVKNPRFGWCADPFLYKYNGEYYIFAEMYMYAMGYGGIGYCKWQGDRFSKWKLVIKEPYHLSYPNIFKYRDTIFICPESGASNEIYLYRCVDFPDRWIKDKILFQGDDCADTTYMPDIDGKSNLEYGITWKGIAKGLYFFKLENGEIIIHDGDLVTKDNTYARPAGNYCVENGVVYRPGQIGEPNYGAGLAIIKCDFENGVYHEKVIEKIYADRFCFNKNPGRITGVHTYNRLGECEVIDLQYDKFETISRLIRVVGKFQRRKTKKIFA